MKKVFCGQDSYYIRTLNVKKLKYLVKLDFSATAVTEIDLSYNKNPKYLYCMGSKLRTLNIKNNPALLKLYAHDNKLKSLNVSNNTRLSRLTLQYNNIGSLNIKNNPDLLKAYHGTRWIWSEYYQYNDGKDWHAQDSNNLSIDKTADIISM